MLDIAYIYPIIHTGVDLGKGGWGGGGMCPPFQADHAGPETVFQQHLVFISYCVTQKSLFYG